MFHLLGERLQRGSIDGAPDVNVNGRGESACPCHAGDPSGLAGGLAGVRLNLLSARMACVSGRTGQAGRAGAGRAGRGGRSGRGYAGGDQPAKNLLSIASHKNLNSFSPHNRQNAF